MWESCNYSKALCNISQDEYHQICMVTMGFRLAWYGRELITFYLII